MEQQRELIAEAPAGTAGAAAAERRTPPATISKAFASARWGEGVNPFLYWTLRAILVPAFLVYFRMQRIGREHLPTQRPAAARLQPPQLPRPVRDRHARAPPVYYMAKRELFEKRWQAWILNAPRRVPGRSRRGRQRRRWTRRARSSSAATAWWCSPRARACAPGPLGEPRRGIGRLALETGAPVAPVAVIGTEDVRRGWRIRPRKVRVRVGRPAASSRPSSAPRPRSPRRVTERVWACVSLQWEWLGGARRRQREAELRRGVRGREVSRAA